MLRRPGSNGPPIRYEAVRVRLDDLISQGIEVTVYDFARDVRSLPIRGRADMAIRIPLVLQAILEDYALPWGGDHGIAHWARVYENGLRLAGETGANVEVVALFAVLHDCRRLNEHTDPDHGPRAAEFAASLRGRLFDLPDHEFRLLHRACHGHTHERTHPDVTVRTCWDADRLDLGRVGITPHPSRLCTEVARRHETIRWADGRASLGFVPVFVWEEWGIDLGDL